MLEKLTIHSVVAARPTIIIREKSYYFGMIESKRQ